MGHMHAAGLVRAAAADFCVVGAGQRRTVWVSAKMGTLIMDMVQATNPQQTLSKTVRVSGSDSAPFRIVFGR